MYSLDEFVHGASAAKNAVELQSSWTTFVEQFGATGYRIIPASAQLAHALYAVLRQTYTFLPKWSAPIVPITGPVNTFGDIAHRLPSGYREFYQEQHSYKYDHALIKQLIDRGPFTKKEALVQFNSPEARRIVGQGKEFGLSTGVNMSHWIDPHTIVATSVYMPTDEIERSDSMRLCLKTASMVFCACYQGFHGDLGLGQDTAPRLTARELDVLHWIALGKTKQEIADRLVVSISTVKRHCENIYLKLGVNSMASAVARAMSYGLIHV